jgi:hypothetical protein
MLYGALASGAAARAVRATEAGPGLAEAELAHVCDDATTAAHMFCAGLTAPRKEERGSDSAAARVERWRWRRVGAALATRENKSGCCSMWSSSLLAGNAPSDSCHPAK